MGERLNRDPLCSECGGRTKVTLTLTNKKGGSIIRRRTCQECGHKFYTEQGEEACIPSHVTVRYSSKKYGRAVWLVSNQTEAETAA